jgi:hypothetical protein
MLRFLLTLLFALLLCINAQAGRHGGNGSNYYVSTAGSDSNDGLSDVTPWQTIGKVTGSVFTPGSAVRFKGGQSFTGSIALTTTTNPHGSFTVSSYGSGQPTITQASNSGSCVTATDIAAPTISNLICTGTGNGVSTVNGIAVTNDQSGTMILAGPTISNNTVSGYGANGIVVQGTGGTSGFSGITISGNTVHDVTGNGGNHTSCIAIFSSSGYGNNSVHSNATISGNLAYNCTGETAISAWTGSGIFISEINGATIQDNVAHDFGANNTFCGGPVGIWTADSTNITIQFNEAYNGQIAGGCDGGGFDLDGGVSNSVAQYNYAHSNVGQGFNVFSYNDGFVTTWSNNVFRYNLSERNGSEVNIGASSGSTMSGASVYNNTLVASSGNSCLLGNQSGGTMTSVIFENNICVAASASDNMISFTHPTGLTSNYNNFTGSAKFSWNGTSYTSFATYQSGASQDANSNTSSPTLNGTAGTGGTCYTSGTPAGPQPCSTVYELKTTSVQVGVGVSIASPGSRDYYGGAIPNGSGTGYNIGAYGGTGVP